jgi:hypothetical protein
MRVCLLRTNRSGWNRLMGTVARILHKPLLRPSRTPAEEAP